MSLMISELYDALMAAGCPEDKARRAAVVMAEIQRKRRAEAMQGNAWLWGIATSLAVVAIYFGGGLFIAWLVWGGHG